LINIYDDEESSEVSLVTPVQITKGKEPEKASSPTPDAQIRGLPQNDQEVESILDTKLLDVLESPMDEIGLGKNKKKKLHRRKSASQRPIIK
jgi:hypothetical protein